MSVQVEKNSKGQVRGATLKAAGQRGLEEDVNMNVSDGSYVEGPSDEKYNFAAVDFSQGDVPAGTMSAAANERGIVRLKGNTDQGSMDLIVDLTKLDAQGKGTVAGRVNGKTIKGKIDPKNPKPTIETDQADRGLGGWLGGVAGGLIGGPVGATIGGMAGGLAESWLSRDISTQQVQFEANRGLWDIVKPLGLSAASVALNVAGNLWNANTTGPLNQVGNAALGALAQRLQ